VTDKRLKLAYVVHTLNPGGTERLVTDMSLAFADRFEITVFCLDEPGEWASTLRARNIAVICLWRQPGFDLSVATRLARYCRDLRIDIIHAHQCTSWFYSALARVFYRRPRLVFEEHGRFFPETDHRLRRFVNRMLIRKLTHRTVAVSADIRDRLVRYEGLDHRDIEVVYNGTAAPEPLAEAERHRMREQLGFREDDFVIGTVGRFDPIKNLPMLVQALAGIMAEQPQARGLLIGDGPEFPKIAALIESSGVGQNIVMTGYRSEARQLVQCMDLFVLSSFSEGTSMALLEAMSAGIPVTVTDVGGNPEIVLADVTGWVIPSDDVRSLHGVLTEAMVDSTKRQRLGLAGMERFDSEFSFSRMIDRYREIYRDVTL
jgi:glycosyltransferase involved in cell wall biosynthesis